MKKWLSFVLLTVFVLALSTPGLAAHKVKIATETFYIAASDPEIKLHVRNKHLSGKKIFPADKIVLFVHGATYPSETAFDIALPGGSWMDYAAERGYDTYLVDIRGYGRSTRPPAMDAPPDQNPAFATTAEAIKDVGAAVDFIRQRRKADKINLVGWSWGTTLMGGFTAQNNDKVAKLVLYAPLWTLKEPPPFSGSGAYRTVTKEGCPGPRLAGYSRGTKRSDKPSGLVR